MILRYRIVATLCGGWLFVVPMTLLAAPTVVSVNGRTLIVGGSSFTVRGVSYSPTPVGSTLEGSSSGCIGLYKWWTDRPAYRADFPLLRQMGANTIRTYDLLNSAATRSQVRDALDEAWANGIYVIAGYYVGPYNPANNAAIQADIVASVNAYKDHPAILMWVIGNEQNLPFNQGNNIAWYNFVNATAGVIKTIHDPNHPVMITEGEILTGPSATDFNIGDAGVQANDANMTNLDLWGVNIYRRDTFEGELDFLATQTTKPLLVSEFGKDAYRDSLGAEDETIPANHLQSLWGEIDSRLSVSVSTRPLVGGVVFEWSDEWWKSTGGGCATHDNAYFFDRSLDIDPNYNEEWFGLVAVEPINAFTNPAGTNRRFRQGYYTMQTLWAGASSGGGNTSSGSFFESTVRNYPNPIRLGRGSTTFIVRSNESGRVSIDVFDVAGQKVVGLEPVVVTAGVQQQIIWTGRNAQGEFVSPGLYYARITGKGASREDTQYRKVVGVK